MAADAVPAPSDGGFFARTGALVVAPRRLARRDLARRDGKAGDDLIVLVVVALLVDGAPQLARAAAALAAGRVNTALHRLLDVLRLAVPLIVLWLLVAALFLVFTWRAARRAPGELAARVVAGVVLGSLALGPFVDLVPDEALRFAAASVPWAVGAVLFGLVLREAFEDPTATVAAPLPRARLATVILLAALGVGAAVRVHGAWRAAERDPAITARRDAAAPPIDLPLLGGAGRLELAALRGRPVIVTFWATWCAPCIEELPVLDRLYRARAAAGGGPHVYAVNVDEPGPDRETRVQRTVERLHLALPVALDDGRAGAAYSVATIPMLVRIDEGGRVREVFDRPLDEAGLRDALR